MKTAAIICEYNPFHNGHKYQIDYIKEKLGVDRIIALMSGDFVQRGEPASYSKEIRTKMALSNGIDCVLLLPAVFSTAPADIFAYAGVFLLNRLNCVDYLVFGSECGDIERLKTCANDISSKGKIDSYEIQSLMKEGLTYAKARNKLFPEYSDILSKPNNILAIEYIISLNELSSTIVPVTIYRNDNGYSNTELSKDSLSSASSIRNAITCGNFEAIKKTVPGNIHSDISCNTIITYDDFSDFLFDAIFRSDSLMNYLDVSRELSDKILKNLTAFNSVQAFIDLLKSKELTYSRISRALSHILLNIKGDNRFYRDNLDSLTHLRMLGFNSEGKELLSAIKNNSSINVIAKVPDYSKEFNDFTKTVFDIDQGASFIYDFVDSKKNRKALINEYSKPVIKV